MFFRSFVGFYVAMSHLLIVGAMEKKEPDDSFTHVPHELQQIIATHTISLDEDFSAIYSLRQTSRQWKAVAESVMRSSGRLVIPLSPTNYQDEKWIGRGVTSFATGIKLVGWDLSNAHLIGQALTSFPFQAVTCIACPSLWSYSYGFVMKSYNDEGEGYAPLAEVIKKQRIFLFKKLAETLPSPCFIGSSAPYVNCRDMLKPKYVYNLSQQQIASALETNDFDFLNKHISEDLGETGIISLTSVLHHFPNLKELRLWSFTSIGKNGGEALGQSLEHLLNLRYIEIHGAMGPEGTKGFAQGLVHTPHIVGLDLEESGVGDVGCEAIVHQFPNLPELKHINFSYVPHGTPGGNGTFITNRGIISLREGMGQYASIVSLILKGHALTSEDINNLIIWLRDRQNENSFWNLFTTS